MRLAPIILAIIGIWGILYPETLSDSAKGGGRWLFILILSISVLYFYRNFIKKADE